MTTISADSKKVLNRLQERDLWVYEVESLDARETQRRIHALEHAYLIEGIVRRNRVAIERLERELREHLKRLS